MPCVKASEEIALDGCEIRSQHLRNHGEPLVVGSYSWIVTQGVLRGCRISSIHSRASPAPLLFGDSSAYVWECAGGPLTIMGGGCLVHCTCWETRISAKREVRFGGCAALGFFWGVVGISI